MDVKSSTVRPIEHDGYWHLLRPVPQEFKTFDKRDFVRINTGITIAEDPSAFAAEMKVRALEEELQRLWKQGASEVDVKFAEIAFEALNHAEVIGMPVLSLDQVKSLDLVSLYSRLHKSVGGVPAGEFLRTRDPKALGKAQLAFGLPEAYVPKVEIASAIHSQRNSS